MRIGFAGTPDIAGRILATLASLDIEVALVITKPDTVKGRGKQKSQSPVAKIAEELRLEVVKPESLKSENIKQLIVSKNLDLFVVVAYGNLVPTNLLDLPKYGWFNLHFSLLPKYRGAAPVQRAIMDGESETGVTFFKLDEGMDTGPILGQKICPISNTDDALTIFDKLLYLGTELIINSIKEISSGKFTLIEQNHNERSNASKLQPGEEKIDWNKSQLQVFNLIRGCAAGPIAYTYLMSNRIKVRQVLISDTQELKPGCVRKIAGNIKVGTSTGDLDLMFVQPADRKLMSALDWFNGLHSDEICFQ